MGLTALSIFVYSQSELQFFRVLFIKALFIRTPDTTLLIYLFTMFYEVVTKNENAPKPFSIRALLPTDKRIRVLQKLHTWHLARDIFYSSSFLKETQRSFVNWMKKFQAAVERMGRLVKTECPRAQASWKSRDRIACRVSRYGGSAQERC